MSRKSQIVIAILMSAIVLVSALSMLRTINGPVKDSSSPSAESNTNAAATAQPTSIDVADLPPRPACPSAPVGDLQCLSREGVHSSATEITVVNVWASWCAPCRQELPMLDEFARSHPQYAVVGVNRDRSAGAPVALLTELGVDLATYWDPAGDFAAARGLPAVLPVTVVFRGDQEVARFPQVFTSSADLAATIDKALR